MMTPTQERAQNGKSKHQGSTHIITSAAANLHNPPQPSIPTSNSALWAQGFLPALSKHGSKLRWTLSYKEELKSSIADLSHLKHMDQVKQRPRDLCGQCDGHEVMACDRCVLIVGRETD